VMWCRSGDSRRAARGTLVCSSWRGPGRFLRRAARRCLLTPASLCVRASRVLGSDALKETREILGSGSALSRVDIWLRRDFNEGAALSSHLGTTFAALGRDSRASALAGRSSVDRLVFGLA
jgi:hypothetical protein